MGEGPKRKFSRGMLAKGSGREREAIVAGICKGYLGKCLRNE
jgi:hypothetical protein